MARCLLCKELTEKLSFSKACLRSLWIFRNLGPEDIEALALQAEAERFAAGAVVFQQGENADRILIIKAGRIRLWKITEEGNEITLDIRQSGDVLGESMFSQDGVFPISATCLEDTYTCGLTRAGFERLVLSNPNIGLQVIKNLSQRIDLLTSRVSDMSFSNLEERLYRILVAVAQEHGKESEKGLILPMPLTHEDLSFLVGAHRVSITRAMKTLHSSGQVMREGRYLIIRQQIT